MERKFVYYPTNCTSMLQLLVSGIVRYFKHLYGKHVVQKAVCLMDLGRDIELKVDVLQVIYFTEVA